MQSNTNYNSSAYDMKECFAFGVKFCSEEDYISTARTVGVWPHEYRNYRGGPSSQLLCLYLLGPWAPNFLLFSGQYNILLIREGYGEVGDQECWDPGSIMHLKARDKLNFG